MKKRIKRKYLKHETKRMHIIFVIAISFFIFITLRLIYLNVIRETYYNILLTKKEEKYVYGQSAPRGKILDRNGIVLVDNKAVKTIYYKKESGITINEEIDLAYKASLILNINYNEISKEKLKAFYYLINKDEIDNLLKKEKKDLENRKIDEEQYNRLKLEKITDKMLKTLEEEDKKAAYIYSLMNNGYSYDDKIIKNKNVTDKEYVYFSENNIKGFGTKINWERYYPYKTTLENILGTISEGIPKEEKDLYLSKGYSLNDKVGISGLEKYYEDILKGEKAVYKLNGNEKILVEKEKKGTDIMLSIDINLQQKIDKMIKEELFNAKKEANTNYFNKSYVVISNPYTGEILSMSGVKLIDNKAYDNSEGVFLNTITPGSVVKGASMIVGYESKVIDVGTYQQDSCIYLNNLPEKCSWKTLGYINDIDALAYSSNVYQYKIAMKVAGFDYYPGKTLVIDEKAFDTYRNMFYRFGLGVKTGIDYPKEELGYSGTNKSGDLLINFAIGQYDTYTTLQLSQYVSTIATKGSRYKPRFLKAVLDDNGKVLYEIKPVLLNKLETNDKYIDRVSLGFRKVMTTGTGIGYISESYYPSGKTGTSESFLDTNNDGKIDTATISNNFVGYAPSDKPTMAIAASFPDISSSVSSKYKSNANQRIVKRATDIYFSIYNKNGKKL